MIKIYPFYSTKGKGLCVKKHGRPPALVNAKMWALPEDNYCMYLRLLSQGGRRKLPFLELRDAERLH